MPVNFAGRLKISSSLYQQTYTWRPETFSELQIDYSLSPWIVDFLPGQSIPTGFIAVEFPPLEDWDNPFWKELREKTQPEGTVCQLRIEDDQQSFL